MMRVPHPCDFQGCGFSVPLLDSFHRSIPMNPVARRRELCVEKTRTLENRKGAAPKYSSPRLVKDQIGSMMQGRFWILHQSPVTDHQSPFLNQRRNSGARRKRAAPAAGLLLALRGADNQILDGVGRSGVPTFGLR